MEVNFILRIITEEPGYTLKLLTVLTAFITGVVEYGLDIKVENVIIKEEYKSI